jgi:predicted nucleotide-binding protein
MLQVARHTAEEILADYVEQGQTLIARAHLIGDSSDHESWGASRRLWIEATADGLAQMYGGPESADRFKSAASAVGGGPRWQVEYRRESRCVEEAIDVLVSLQDQLELEEFADPELAQEPSAGDAVEQELSVPDEPGPELASAEEPPADSLSTPELAPTQEAADDLEPSPESSVGSALAPARSPGLGSAQESLAGGDLVQQPLNGAPSPIPVSATESRANGLGHVFLVHGRNEGWKQAVAGLLEGTGSHEVTILNERPNDRKALVQHFEDQAREPGYAVILLTADDVGAPRMDSDREPYFSPRARQAVVFEMGVLVATLTPEHMCVLYEDGVELPCDLDGVAYVRLDLANTWKYKLLLKLRGAGFDYDLNRLASI